MQYKQCQTAYATEKSCSQGLNENRMQHQSCLKAISIILNCHNFYLFISLGNICLVDGMLYNSNGGTTVLQHTYSIVHAGNMFPLPPSDHQSTPKESTRCLAICRFLKKPYPLAGISLVPDWHGSFSFAKFWHEWCRHLYLGSSSRFPF